MTTVPLSAAASPPTTNPTLDRARRYTLAGVSVFFAAVTARMVFRGQAINPDAIFPALFVVALLLGRGRTFLLDWLPFLALLLGYEALRGLADDVNTRVHWTAVIDADTILGFGMTPTERLQSLLYVPGEVNLLNAASSFLYLVHFLAPVLLGLALWLRNRHDYWRFTIALLATSFAGFVTYIAFPVAPPWMAADQGLLAPAHHLIPITLGALFDSHDSVELIWSNFASNPVAAFPSLHAAYPMLIALALVRGTTTPWRWLAFAYPAAVGFAIVYAGEHYVVDAIAGYAYATAAFTLATRLIPVESGVGSTGSGLTTPESRPPTVAR